MTPGDKGPSLAVGGRGGQLSPTLHSSCVAIFFLPFLVNPQMFPKGLAQTALCLLGERTSDFCSIVNKLALSARLPPEIPDLL